MLSLVRLACEAMATRFEVVLHGEDPHRLRAAGEEALAEIRRIERRLSYFLPTSDVGRANRLAARGSVGVEPGTVGLLERARELWLQTGGAFDPTVGPLMRCWGFRSGTGAVPEPDELEAARDRVGMRWVELDPGSSTVRFAREGVELDLGAIGKGYALDEAGLILRDAGITSALLHGGTSSVLAVGTPPDQEAWRVAIRSPGGAGPEADSPVAAIASLADRALSVSAAHGRWFREGDHQYGHVLDPRSGRPAEGARLAAVITDCATDADALSTALLTLGLAEHSIVTDRNPELPVLLLGSARGPGDGKPKIFHRSPGGPTAGPGGFPQLTLHGAAESSDDIHPK